MVMQQPFTTSSPNVVSYDFFEFASNTGYKTFYGADTSAGTYILTTTTPYSHNEYIDVSSGVDLDFDIQFKKALILEGDIISNVSMTWDNTTAGAVNPSYTLAITARHVRGGTETELGTTSYTYTAGYSIGSDQGVNVMNLIKVDATKKSFAPSDTLRINITISSLSNGTFWMCHDPKNRTVNLNPTGAVDSSVLSFAVPFNTN